MLNAFVGPVKSDQYIRNFAQEKPLGGMAKRAFDIFLAVVMLFSGAVLLVVILVLIKMRCSGPVFYSHERIGFRGRKFRCLKFRTMVEGAEKALEEYLAGNENAREEFMQSRKLREDPRIIPGVQCFLRRTSLDELPQIINVIRGEMSLVGPRPVTEDEVELYGNDKWHYLRTRPGITGLWQVSGRSSLPFEDRVRLDTHYSTCWSLLLDLKILIRTISVVFAAKGAY